MEETIDRRPSGRVIDGSGYSIELDENRTVSGCKTESGMAFCFESHGIKTHIALTLEAISAVIALTEKLHNIKFDIHGIDE